MKIQSVQPEKRRGRTIGLALLVTWGIASLVTLGYQQLAIRPAVPLEQPEG